jgi:GT2 family glycosyltransferase
MSQINPSNSRAQKLKKLYQISRELINEFGYRYFLRIALEELFTQKGKLFSPDIIPQDIEDEFILDYDDLLENYNLEKNLSQSKIQGFSTVPLFSLVLFVDGNSPQIEKILKTQIYNNFEFVLVSSSEKHIDSFVSQNNISNFQKLVVDSPKIRDIMFVSKADYFIFLNNFSVLHSDFLFNIVSKINQNFLGDVYYCDEDYAKNGKRVNPFFKPDWSPYLLRSFNYIGNSFVMRKQILNKLSNFVLDKNFHYNLMLHCAEISNKFVHISIPSCSILKTDDIDQTEVLSQHIQRLGLNAEVERGKAIGTFRVRYLLENEPKVSIIIPTKNNKSLLKRCIESIENNTNYKNFEIIIVDNNTDDDETLEYYNSMDYEIIPYKNAFNFSKMNNLGVTKAQGDYILCLNDDTKVIEPNWLTEMVSMCKQDDVGIVGAMLLHSNGTIQHAGAVFLKSGSGFHVFENIIENEKGFFNLHNVIRNFSAVTGACLLIKKSNFEKVGGYDDSFDLFYGDADLCLKTLNIGLHVVYTPFARLLHEGSSTIKKNSKTFFAIENHFSFIKKWPHLKQGDPFYNRNLGWDYSIAKLEHQMGSIIS